jgi:hypothetical protein
VWWWRVRLVATTTAWVSILTVLQVSVLPWTLSRNTLQTIIITQSDFEVETTLLCNSDYIASNERMIGEWQRGKYVEVNGNGLNLRHYPKEYLFPQVTRDQNHFNRLKDKRNCRKIEIIDLTIPQSNSICTCSKICFYLLYPNLQVSSVPHICL